MAVVLPAEIGGRPGGGGGGRGGGGGGATRLVRRRGAPARRAARHPHEAQRQPQPTDGPSLPLGRVAALAGRGRHGAQREQQHVLVRRRVPGEARRQLLRRQRDAHPERRWAARLELQAGRDHLRRRGEEARASGHAGLRLVRQGRRERGGHVRLCRELSRCRSAVSGAEATALSGEPVHPHAGPAVGSRAGCCVNELDTAPDDVARRGAPLLGPRRGRQHFARRGASCRRQLGATERG